MKLTKEQMQSLDQVSAMYFEGYKDGVAEGRRQVWKEVNEYLKKIEGKKS